MERRNEVVGQTTDIQDRVKIKRKIGYNTVEDNIQMPTAKHIQMETS